MFNLKKILSAFLYPLPAALICLLISCLLFRKNHKKTAISLFSFSLITLYLTSITAISNGFTEHFENRFPLMVNLPQHVDRIVVLGAGTRGRLSIASQQLNAPSLSRVIEGIRLTKIGLHQHQPMLLILSGGGLKPPYCADIMRELAIKMGIPKANTIIEDHSLDTHDEAVLLQPILKKQPFVLVTSGVHMQRSMALFTHLGMHPMAAPTQIQHKTRYAISIKNYIPHASALVSFNSAWHEQMGLIWSSLRGQI